jgi:phenylacetate-CoA ligase
MLPRRLYYTLKMMVNQWKSPKDIQKLKEKRLRFIVDHAYRHTEFYHTKFKNAGVHPSDICTVKDLKKIPVTTKDEIIENREAVIAKGYSEKNTHVVNTSGSTGRMLYILQDIRAVEANEAAVTRAYNAMGARIFRDKIAYIRHMSVESVDQFLGPIANFIAENVSKNLWIPAHTDTDTIIAKVKEYNPTVLTGYPSSLYVVAKRMKEEGITLRPRFLMSGGELLTEETRTFLQDVFQCDMYNFYGAYELMVVAWECKKHGMHMDDMNILEFLQDGTPVAPGEPGEVVGTNLWYMAMPFIRYNVGDIASASDDVCECGRGLPVMDVMEGRKDDFLVLPSGQLVGPRAVKPIVMTFPEVDKLQIIQEKKDFIRVLIVEKEEFNRKDQLKQKLQHVLKEDVTVEIEIVDDIPLVSGKLRAVISKVSS